MPTRAAAHFVTSHNCGQRFGTACAGNLRRRQRGGNHRCAGMHDRRGVRVVKIEECASVAFTRTAPAGDSFRSPQKRGPCRFARPIARTAARSAGVLSESRRARTILPTQSRTSSRVRITTSGGRSAIVKQDVNPANAAVRQHSCRLPGFGTNYCRIERQNLVWPVREPANRPSFRPRQLPLRRRPRVSALPKQFPRRMMQNHAAPA